MTETGGLKKKKLFLDIQSYEAAALKSTMKNEDLKWVWNGTSKTVMIKLLFCFQCEPLRFYFYRPDINYNPRLNFCAAPPNMTQLLLFLLFSVALKRKRHTSQFIVPAARSLAYLLTWKVFYFFISFFFLRSTARNMPARWWWRGELRGGLRCSAAGQPMRPLSKWLFHEWIELLQTTRTKWNNESLLFKEQQRNYVFVTW